MALQSSQMQDVEMRRFVTFVTCNIILLMKLQIYTKHRRCCQQEFWPLFETIAILLLQMQECVNLVIYFICSISVIVKVSCVLGVIADTDESVCFCLQSPAVYSTPVIASVLHLCLIQR